MKTNCKNSMKALMKSLKIAFFTNNKALKACQKSIVQIKGLPVSIMSNSAMVNLS